MRPVREITAEEENWRTEDMIPGDSRFQVIRRDPVQPEPIGTIVLMAFRVTGYDPDCDGSLMGRFEHIDRDGESTGWTPKSIGLNPTTDLVVTLEEWQAMFR
jgi:hypothetical protein